MFSESFSGTPSLNFVLFQPKKKVGKKVAAAPLVVKKVEVKKIVNPLFEKRQKNFAIGKFLLLFLAAFGHSNA